LARVNLTIKINMHFGASNTIQLKMHFDVCRFDYLTKYAFWHMPIWLFS